jgi:hypothetical protein
MRQLSFGTHLGGSLRSADSEGGGVRRHEGSFVMKVVLFCGGAGLRLRGVGDDVPKPMVPIGARPILWHLMKYYAYFGHHDFILCLGHKGEVIKNYFLHLDAVQRISAIELRGPMSRAQTARPRIMAERKRDKLLKVNPEMIEAVAAVLRLGWCGPSSENRTPARRERPDSQKDLGALE